MAMAADQKIRWGIIGTGGIAATFAGDLTLLPDAELVAVGSRSQESADRFGDRFSIGRRYASYEQLVADPDVDAVYVSTPHPMHHSAALLGIRAGKAVLVEKPFTINAHEARELVAEARSRGTFLMEAMWTRFLPHVVKVRDLLAQGRLGDVRSVLADHGQWFAKNAEHRLFAPELGGGALLDLGIYPISFASMIFGRPTKVTAVSDPAFTGVDGQTSVVLQYEGGEQAVLFTSLETRSPNWAAINGTEARIEIDGVFYAPSNFKVVHRDGDVEQFDVRHEGKGLRHQAAEVGRCLREGRTESEILPLDETVAIMETLDEVRRQIGLRYPSE
ncbi:MAG: Gfo/Idh/MocA family protein [Acidothermaceae bacterium]